VSAFTPAPWREDPLLRRRKAVGIDSKITWRVARVPPRVCSVSPMVTDLPSLPRSRPTVSSTVAGGAMRSMRRGKRSADQSPRKAPPRALAEPEPMRPKRHIATCPMRPDVARSRRSIDAGIIEPHGRQCKRGGARRFLPRGQEENKPKAPKPVEKHGRERVCGRVSSSQMMMRGCLMEGFI